MTLPTRRLGSTGFDVTVVGLGAWAIGGSASQGGWGRQDDAESVAAIHRAVELGINWIDTAPAYGFGHAEEVVGAALAALSADERPLVFTKCGLVWEAGEKTVRNVLARDSIRRECEASLRRLKVDCLDLLQIHWPAHDGTPPEESWQTLSELVEEGKTRAIGVSNYDLALLERCEAVRHIDTFQPELNLIARGAKEGIEWCRVNGTGVIVYSPMRSGLLTDTSLPGRWAALPEDDWRKDHPDFQEPTLGRNLLLVERLRAIAGELDATVAEVAIAWTLCWPGVSGAIVGARRPEQVEGWIGAAALELDEQRLDRIGDILRETGAGSGPVRPPVGSVR
jgi:aryl-alcohol dehydrogenase-like predicted oxidoreductase